MKVSSNKIVVEDAISDVLNVESQDLYDQSVELSFSNITAMTTGVELSNQIIGDVSQVIGSVFGQANKLHQLANLIAQRDQQDGAEWK